MALKDWSTTAGDNDDADASINWLENQAPSTVNNSARAMMAAIRTWYNDYEWRDLGHVPTRTGNTTFTVPTDLTTTYTAGRVIRCTDSTTIYGFITASSFSSVTTVTISASSNLSASLTAVALGPEVTNRAISPFGIRWNKGTDIASASALTIPKDGNYFDVTGTTTVTSITTLGVTGMPIIFRFTGILTLTHHATDLFLPGAANITTAAGDHGIFIEYASGDWRCISFIPATVGILTAATQAQQEAASSTSTYVSPGRQQYHPGHPKGWVRFNGTGTLAIVASYNVNSVTDIQTGNYGINWETDFADGNYCAVCQASVEIGTNDNAPRPVNIQSVAAGTLTIRTGTAALEDQAYVAVAAYGDQA